MIAAIHLDHEKNGKSTMGLHLYPVTIQSVSPPIPSLLSRPTPENRSRPTLVYFHGLNGSRNQIFQDKYVEFAEAIQQLGCNLFSGDLRNHGERRENKEKPAIDNILKDLTQNGKNPFDGAIKDIQAILDALVDKQIAIPGKIAVAGLSWGAMHAMYALKTDRRVKGCIAMLPVCKITSMLEFQHMEGNALIQKYEPLNFVESIAPKPLLMLTAEKGVRSDPRYAIELFNSLRAEYREAEAEKRLAYNMILGAGHAYHSQMTQLAVNWLKHYLLEEE
jgi:dienelactone hydrolase